MSVIKYGKDIPTFVLRLRQEMGWSQSDLANLIGVNPQYVSNIERGINRSFVGFAAKLYPVISVERQQYLSDLIAETSSDNAVARLRAKAQGKSRVRKL